MPRSSPLYTLVGLTVLAAGFMGITAMARGTEAASPMKPHAVDARFAFGLQNIPKFDERAGHGAWNGTRGRGLAMAKDLGANVGREGLLWSRYEPQGPNPGPYVRDFDDAIDTEVGGGMSLEAMVTETPFWASTAPGKNAKKPDSFKSAPPRGLYEPTFADGTDKPGPGKKINPANPWAMVLAEWADRYHGKVRYWQIWNEPDYPDGVLTADMRDPSQSRRSWMGSVGDYARLLHVSRAVLTAYDPGSKIATGGLGHSEYLDAMLKAGAGADFDYVDFHAYGWPGSDSAIDMYKRVHDEMAGVMQRRGVTKGLICSETGYSAAEPSVQADYVAKLFPTALALGVESTMYYADTNPCWKNMGLIDWRTMSQKTSGYWAYKHATMALADAKAIAPIEASGARGYRIDRHAGGPLYLVWGEPGAATRSISLPVGAGTWRMFDASGHPMGSLTGPTVHLSVGTSPRWLDGDSRRAYVAPTANPKIFRPGLAIAAAHAGLDGKGDAAAAIDADPDTQWVNDGYKVPDAWLSVVLAHPTTPKRLRVKTGPMPANTWFDVETSANGQRWTTAATNLRSTSWHMEDYPLHVGAAAKYVRLHWHNPSKGTNHFVVFELEAY